MIRRFAYGLFAAVLATTGTTQTGPAAPSRGSEHDLRVSNEARAVLVETRERAQGSVTLKQGKSESKVTIDYATEARWLDEVGKPGGQAVHHKRTFLQFQKTEDGLVHDPGLEGVSVMVAMIGDHATAHVQAPRQVLKSRISQQCANAAAIGLYVELPARMEVGGKFPLSCEALLGTILDIDGDIDSFKSEMTLANVDLETGRANLIGTASFGTRFDKAGAAYTSTYEGPLRAEIDLITRTLAQVSYSGTSTVKGSGRFLGKVSGEVAFEASAIAKPVNDLAAYRVKNPTFRDNTYRIGAAQFRLPSCWMPLPVKERGKRAFIDSRTESGPAIEFVYSASSDDPSDDEFMSQFLSAARREAPDAKARKASFPTGDGFTFECSTDTQEKARGFVAPFGEGMLRVRWVGPASGLRKADSTLKAVQDSLEEVEE